MRLGSTLAAAIGIALLAAACGEDPATDSDAQEPAEEVEGDDPAATSDVDLALGDTEFGEVLVDGDGMTLYLFTEDPPGESVCVDDCLAAWPPLLVDDDPRVGEGVDAALVGTIDRDDGGVQVTYDDAPLYTWASDERPGDTTGQGVQDVWFVVTADGSAVTDAAGDAGDETPEEPQETRPEY